MQIPPRYHNITDAGEALALLEKLRSGSVKYIGFDTETSGLTVQDRVFGFSITVNGADTPVGDSYWINLLEVDEDTDAIAMDILTLIASNDGGFGVIMHNSIFDIMMLEVSFGLKWRRERLNDTMLMSRVTTRFAVNSLKVLGRTLLKEDTVFETAVIKWFTDNGYIDHTAAKALRKKNEKSKNPVEVKEYQYMDLPPELVFPYACADTELTVKLFFAMVELYRQQPHISLYPHTPHIQDVYKIERRVAPITANLTAGGMHVDLKYMTDLVVKAKEQHERCVAEFDSAYPGVSTTSSPQLVKLFFTDLKLPVAFLTKNRTPSTDADSLEVLQRYHEAPRLLHRVRKLHTSIQTLERLIRFTVSNGDIHTIHTDYNQILETGRISSKDPPLQNILNDDKGKLKGIFDEDIAAKHGGGLDLSIRNGFIAPEDCLYVKLDYGAFELRLMGNASGDTKFTGMVLDGLDLHSWLATQLYSAELDAMMQAGSIPVEITKGHDALNARWGLNWKYWAVKSKSSAELRRMRTVVKNCSFAIYYGSGASNISKKFNVTVQEAERLKAVCVRSFPELFAFREKYFHRCKHAGRLYTMFGRLRPLGPRLSHEGATLNSLIQGTAADFLKLAMADAHDILKHSKSRLCASVHDEIQVYLHKDDLALAPQLIEVMERRRLPQEIAPLEMIAEMSAHPHVWGMCRELNHSGDIVAQLNKLMEEK